MWNGRMNAKKRILKVKYNKMTVLFKCITDIETYLISSHNISDMTPIISQNGEPYIKVEYFDDELCVNNSIYCTKVERIN